MSELIDLKEEILRLMRLPKAAFGTIANQHGMSYPFVSLVIPALDASSAPLLLLSDLSDHVRNIKESPQASLLFDGTNEMSEPLAGPRLTLIGEVRQTMEPRHKATYLAARPEAKLYAGFNDFRFYRFAIAEAVIIAGFGRITKLSADELGELFQNR